MQGFPKAIHVGSSAQRECWAYYLSRGSTKGSQICSLVCGAEHLVTQSFQTASSWAMQTVDVSEVGINTNAIVTHWRSAVPTELHRDQGHEEGAGGQKC